MLGTLIHKALSSVGITPERVEEVTGKPCGCRKRIEALDRATEVVIQAVREPWSRRVRLAWLSFLRDRRARRLKKKHSVCKECPEHPLDRRRLTR